jgi:long-subunit fatty acid transport protein
MRSNIIFVEIDPPDQLLEIPRNLRNTVSVRGLLGYTFLEHFEAALSFGYDPSAVPPNSLDAALADANKFQAGAGIRGLFNEKWSVMLSYSHDFYQTVEVTRSIQEPTTNGTYRDQRRWLNLSLEARL